MGARCAESRPGTGEFSTDPRCRAMRNAKSRCSRISCDLFIGRSEKMPRSASKKKPASIASPSTKHRAHFWEPERSREIGDSVASRRRDPPTSRSSDVPGAGQASRVLSEFSTERRFSWDGFFLRTPERFGFRFLAGALPWCGSPVRSPTRGACLRPDRAARARRRRAPVARAEVAARRRAALPRRARLALHRPAPPPRARAAQGALREPVVPVRQAGRRAEGDRAAAREPEDLSAAPREQVAGQAAAPTCSSSTRTFHATATTSMRRSPERGPP